MPRRFGWFDIVAQCDGDADCVRRRRSASQLPVGMSLQPFGWKLTLQELVGWLNAPFAWLMGIRWKDCPLIGQILGERIVLNEFFGYLTLTQQKAFMDERSFVLATYALCGFANFGSIAIQIGGIGALAPGRR